MYNKWDKSPFAFVAFGVLVFWLFVGAAHGQTPVPTDVHPAAAHHELSHAAWVFIDPSRLVDIQQVLSPESVARFKPPDHNSAPTHFGLTQSAIWLRLDLRAPNHTAGKSAASADALDDWLLEVAFPLLDEVDMYEVNAQGTVLASTFTGRTRPFSARALPHRHFVFPVSLPPGQVRTLYLRIASVGTLSAPLALHRAADLWKKDLRTYCLLAMYFGLLLGMFCYNLFLYISLREMPFLLYVLFSGSMAVGQLGLTGLGAQYLWTEDVSGSVWLPRTALAAAAFFATRFVRHFLNTSTCFPRFDWVLNAEAVFAFMTVVVVFAAPLHWSAWMLNALSATIGISMVLLGFAAWLSGHAGARYFLLAWFMLLLGAVALPLHNLGVLPINLLTRNALMLGSAMEMLLLSIALADRFQITRRENEQALERALDSELQHVEALRTSEQELEKRVLERTLALERANQQLKDNEHLLTVQAFQDPLTTLGNRALLRNRMEQAIERSRRYGQGFGLLLIDLDGFKAVNDHHGHAAGDALLVKTAQRLSAAVRGADTVARVGGDEFVLLLEDVADHTRLDAFKAKLAHALTQPVMLEEGVAVQVAASIGVALFPVDAQDAEALLQVADHAMYKEKNATRQNG